jgi:hypothetical protein
MMMLWDMHHRQRQQSENDSRFNFSLHHIVEVELYDGMSSQPTDSQEDDTKCNKSHKRIFR